MKIKELFNFEDIQQVIEIGKIKNEREMVEKFVVSDNLKDDLLEFLDYLKGNKRERNTSVNVIGNYGTGKSHLLSFLSIILSNPEMVQYINNEEIKEAFSALNKEFFVVKYELPGLDKDLSEIFFYRVRKQLEENYGIEIRDIDLKTEEKDPKELIEEILLKIKEIEPNKGLIVIFDEYSDFLKSKESYKQNRDLQFTRQIAECSIDQDFILMLSMQEYIFSNPAYKDKADLINKIEKRFLNINITSENIEDIVAQRIVSKTPNQIQELKRLFEGIKEEFPNIALEEDRYINLFPVHPYVIEMFSKLTLFENRPILTFISDQTKKIQEEEFPAFITYDLIYDDLIESQHTIKNKELVKPVIEIVKSLRDVVPRLDQQYREIANILINALAIKNLVTPPDSKGDRKGGDTPIKFAENLCISSNSKVMDSSDYIDTVLNKLIENCEGQFISNDKSSNTYYLDLERTTDYEQIINNKAATMDDLTYNNEVFVEDSLLNLLGFELTNDIKYADNNKKYVIEDSVKWNQRNSFREGILAINIGNDLLIEDSKDYLINIKGFKHYTINEFESNQIIVKPAYTEEFRQSVRRLAAVNQFLKTKTHVEVMKSKKRSIIDNEVQKHFKNAFLESTIKYKGNIYTLEDLGIYTEIIAEIFAEIKEKLLGEDLVSIYPKYPMFKSNATLSKNNIESTINIVFKEISNKSSLTNFELKSHKILSPLGLYKDDIVDVNNSEYALLILDKVESTNKQIPIESIVKEFKEKPYGLHKEITYLIIAVLFRNGNITLKSKTGESYSASDFPVLFKSGIKAFQDLKYISKEEGPTVNAQELFDIFELDRTLLELKKNYPVALKQYTEKYNTLMTDISFINREFKSIKQSSDIGLPLKEIEEKIDFIENSNIKNLEVNIINDFNKFDYSKENLENIKQSYELISILKSFIEDYNNFIFSGIKYMKNTIEFMENDFFKENDKKDLIGIYNDSLNIISNSRKILKADERRPINGKTEMFKNKYKSLYYDLHENTIGNKVDWDYLEKLNHSNEIKILNILKNIKALNSSKLRNIQLDIQNLIDFRCTSFSVDELDYTPHCHCFFPNNMRTYRNINAEIDDLYQQVSILLNSWKNEVLTIIQDNKYKLEQLDSDQKEIINKIIISNSLPETIDNNLVSAVNALLEDIEIKEVDFNDLFNVITTEKDTLRVDEILNIFESYLKEGISDLNKARIRVIKNKEE